MMDEKPEYLSRKEAAIFLTKMGCPISPGTLENMACNNNAGKGPRFIRFRWKVVRYLKADLVEWAKNQSEVVE